MAPHDSLGIVEGRQRKDAAIIAANESRLSPASLHALNPKKYARPIPTATETHKLREELARVQTQLIDARAENARLRKTVAALRATISTPTEVLLEKLAQRRNSPHDVIAAYLAELNRRRTETGANEYTRDHLLSPRRSRDVAAPRHVCVWLVRNLCMHYSLPMIGRLLGGRDHTSCMHACIRAEHWMTVDPMLKAAADAVLVKFGCVQQ